MYSLKNAYDIKETLKDFGGKWNKETKAWEISKEAFDELNSRGHTYGMAWIRGWAKVVAEEIENTTDKDER